MFSFIAYIALCSGILKFNPPSKVVPVLEDARQGVGKYEPLTLLQFSDLHGDVENLSRIVEFRDAYRSYIQDAVHCGDAVICYYDNPNPWNSVPGAKDIINVIGNHDCWKGHKLWSQSSRPYDATQEDAYSAFLDGFIGAWNVTQPLGVDNPVSKHFKACYFYKDYPSSGVRLIVLDSIHYGDAQDEWFESVLSDAIDHSYWVVVATHYQAQSGLDKFSCSFTSDLEDVPSVADPGESQMERLSDRAFCRVDSFIDKGGRFVCWLNGHTHLDMIGTVHSHSRQLQITVDKAGEKDMYMKENRRRGSRFQDSFNLITINRNRSDLTIDRIGCTIDELHRRKSHYHISLPD